MNAKRTYYALIASLILLLIAIPAAAYGMQQLLTEQSNQLVQHKAELAALQQEQTDLVRAKREILANESLYKITKTVVPQNKDQTQAVRQIVKLAADNNVSLQSITFPASTLGTGPKTTAAPNPNSSKVKLSQLTPVKNIPGVYSLPLTVTSDPAKLVTYAQLISFLSSLEQNRLTAMVSNINITPDTQAPGRFTFNLNLEIYIKP